MNIREEALRTAREFLQRYLPCQHALVEDHWLMSGLLKTRREPVPGFEPHERVVLTREVDEGKAAALLAAADAGDHEADIILRDAVAGFKRLGVAVPAKMAVYADRNLAKRRRTPKGLTTRLAFSGRDMVICMALRHVRERHKLPLFSKIGGLSACAIVRESLSSEKFEAFSGHSLNLTEDAIEKIWKRKRNVRMMAIMGGHQGFSPIGVDSKG